MDEIYAARKLFELDPAAHCRFLGIEVTGEPTVLPDVLPPITLPGDILLVRVAPHRLAHVVHVLDRPVDLEARMMLYRSAICRRFPDDEVGHYVVVLRGDEEAPGTFR
jgi:hypothetical protein